jgi:hypothetical protein
VDVGQVSEMIECKLAFATRQAGNVLAYDVGR